MKKLKLSELTKNALSQKGLKNVKGGVCACGCRYEGTPGGSSTTANGQANRNGGGLETPSIGPISWFIEENENVNNWVCKFHF